MKMLIVDFIFEVADSGRKTTVGSHIGIANEAQTQFEVECLASSGSLLFRGVEVRSFP